MIAGSATPHAGRPGRHRDEGKYDELVEALDGTFDDHHGELAGLLLDEIAVLDGKISQLNARIEQMVAAIPAAWGINADGLRARGRHRPGRGGAARRSPAGESPGVSPMLARAIIAEEAWT